MTNLSLLDVIELPKGHYNNNFHRNSPFFAYVFFCIDFTGKKLFFPTRYTDIGSKMISNKSSSKIFEKLPKWPQ